MGNEIKIRLSAGLLAAAAVHALLFAGVFEGLHRYRPTEQDQAAEVQLPVAPSYSSNYQLQGYVERLQEPPQVNTAATGEKKMQIGSRWCPTCPNAQPTRRPTYVQPSVQPTYVQPQPSATKPLFVQTQNPIVAPKKYQLAVFVGNDAKSKQLLNWINTYPKFQTMRNSTDIQVYAAGDALYRARFASIVRPDQFPAIVLTDAGGGHIHAAGGPMLPSSPEALYADCIAGARNYLDAKGHAPASAQSTANPNGALKTKGYSWDESINPSMQLMQQADCSGPLCRPGDRVLDLLDEAASSQKNALMWLSPQEMVIIAVVILVGYTIVKRQQDGSAN